ncbi:hypothetical protein [Flavobacterium lindanitolerans]|uniref:hypothetical protein n=1 Tax=Flavobacterium lindanitolerans TaxID=428988 RepID=UPI0031D90B5C
MNVSSVFSRPSRSGCKGNTLFESRKPFRKKIFIFFCRRPYRFCGRQRYGPFPFLASFSQNFFPESRYRISSMNVALIAGAKVKTFFETRKFIFGKFYPFFKPASCQYLPMNFAFIAGAKVAPFSASASFIATFFQTFLQDAGKQKPIAELFLRILTPKFDKPSKTREADCKVY